MQNNDGPEYTYRFWGIDEGILDILKRNIQAEEKWNKKIHGYVACIDANDAQVCNDLSSVLYKLDLSDIDHGLYISLVTDSDQAGFTVPDYIMKLLRDHQGTLDVSFIKV